LWGEKPDRQQRLRQTRTSDGPDTGAFEHSYEDHTFGSVDGNVDRETWALRKVVSPGLRIEIEYRALRGSIPETGPGQRGIIESS
jgi:hypothetical protein